VTDDGQVYAKHATNLQNIFHPMVKKSCGITVRFLSCNKIKVTTICDGYGTLNYPIKEPREMKEPAQCPK